MSSRFTRGNKLYAKIQDVDGIWRQVATGFDVGQEAAADKWISDREIDVERERRARLGKPIEDELTVNGWAKEWGSLRTALERDGNHDYARIRDHVLPQIGTMLIKDVRATHIVDVFHKIITTPLKATGEPPAPRTVHNIYLATSAMFRAAVKKGKTAQTPCILTSEDLGSKVDQDPEWRAKAQFDRERAQVLISTPLIPWDRRVAYSIEVLSGARPGEVAALRWRHRVANKPLRELVVAKSLNSKRGKEKATKTKAVKHIPEHPTLAAILSEWWLSGWELMMGRPPTPDDLIVPLPPDDADARTKRKGTEPYRTTYYAGRRWAEDMLALGWTDQQQHYNLRATFITLALEDGADEHIIENRVTHTKKRRGAFDGYNRGQQWAKVCAEVAKLKLSRVIDGEDHVRRLEVAAGDAPQDLGAFLVQSEKLAEMSAGSGLRRRVSNPALALVPGGRCETSRADEGDGVAPDRTVLHQTAPNMVKSACDHGIALLRASVSDRDETL